MGSTHPTAAIVLATSAWGEAAGEAAAAASERLGCAACVGGTVYGVLEGGTEHTLNPAVAVLAVEGLAAQPFLLDSVSGEEAHVGAEIRDLLDTPLRSEDLVLVFPDAKALLAAPVVDGLRKELCAGRVVGLGMSAIESGAARQWQGGACVEGGVSGLVLRSSATPAVDVAQGTVLVSPAIEVSRAKGHWILELEGERALDRYSAIAREPLASDLQRALQHVLIAIPPCGERKVDLATSRIRKIVGLDEARGAIALPHEVKRGDRIAFALLDARVAREQLGEMLARAEGGGALGLYFGCRTRGESLFGDSGLEAGYLDRVGQSCPLIGATGPYQIAPLGPDGPPELLTYAAALTRIRPA
jgi:small ligand-binding sensory domain FIST